MVIGCLAAFAAMHRPTSRADSQLTVLSTLVMSASPFSIVATSLTVEWLAHAPQPTAHAENSSTLFWSRSYAVSNSAWSQSAPSVRRHSVSFLARGVLLSSCAHEV